MQTTDSRVGWVRDDGRIKWSGTAAEDPVVSCIWGCNSCAGHAMRKFRRKGYPGGSEETTGCRKVDDHTWSWSLEGDRLTP